jgi:hypothetical protein
MEAAHGFHELGLHHDAWKVLDDLPPEDKAIPSWSCSGSTSCWHWNDGMMALTLAQGLAVNGQYLTSISKIEQDNGVSFFPDLPAETSTSLENDVESRMW